jgi:hypothetical protein
MSPYQTCSIPKFARLHRHEEFDGMSSQLPRWRLPASHQELLRIVLRGASDDLVVSSAQRAAIRQICSAPERHRFEPEDFLIAFKLAIVDAANDVGMPPGLNRNEHLARLVTVYIEEYYGGPADGNGSAHENGHSFRGVGTLLPITNSDGAHTSPDVQPSI